MSLKKNKNIINDIRQYLIDNQIYSVKDEMSLVILDKSFNEYLKAAKRVEEEGQRIPQLDYNGKQKLVINPCYTMMIGYGKEIQRILKEFKVLSIEDNNNNDNPFTAMLNEIKNIEKR